MSLKDLKSNLGDYRKPKSEPLEVKTRIEPSAFNTTPLTDKIKTRNDKNISIQTPEKVGTSKTKITQGDKFKGETSPDNVTQGDKFKGETTPTEVNQAEKFKGETTPKPMSLEERFLGQTTPTEMNNSEQFLGETSPNEMNNQSQFLGETTPNTFDISSNFLGETTPNEFKFTQQFLGETTPKDFSFTQEFLGQTTPNAFNISPNFLGETTPSQFAFNPNLELQGKEPGQVDYFNNEKALGFSPFFINKNSSKFVGISGDSPGSYAFESAQSLYGQLGFVNYFPNIHVTSGFTPNQQHKSPSKFVGVTGNGENYQYTNPVDLHQINDSVGALTTDNFGNTNHRGFLTKRIHKDKTMYLGANMNSLIYTHTGPTEIGVTGTTTDYFANTHANGFTSNLEHKGPSQYVGVNADGTEFTSTSLLDGYLNAFVGLSFQAGYNQYRVGPLTGETPRYSPIGDRYQNDNGELTYASIGDLMEQRFSPSFLDEMYSKYNLQDPEANKFSLIPQPYVLRGIQRADKPEPQNWGFGNPIDDGLIRGGITTSTERAALDLVRLGSFFLSVKGILWSATQIGLQRSNTFNRTWTPANFLAAVGGQHIGFKPDRSGIIGLDLKGRYQKVASPAEYKHKLESLYLKDPNLKTNVLGPYPTQLLSGGTDSVYGIGITNTTRFINTFSRLLSIDLDAALAGIPPSAGGLAAGVQLANAIQNQVAAGQKAGQTLQRYSAFTVKGKFAITNDKPDITYGQDVIDDKHDGIESGQTDTDIDKNFKNRPNLLKSEGNTKGLNNDIADYNMLAYDKIKELSNDRDTNGTTQDFRKKLESGTRGELNSQKTDYSTKNIENPTDGFGFGSPGKMMAAGTGGTTPTLRTGQFDVDFRKLAEFKGHYDEVQVQTIGTANAALDIVPLIFQLGSEKSQLQFRGTISGLTENFSPSYNEIKYGGRAEPAYVYDSFKRDISFNFKVYPTSRVEMQPLWSKLERLATYTMPRYSSTGGYSAPGNNETDSNLLLTIGKLYVKTPMILTSLSYTYSDETAWDIDFGTPMGIDISVGCTILGNDLHQYDSQKVFVFDGNGKDIGVQPISTDFRTAFAAAPAAAAQQQNP